MDRRNKVGREGRGKGKKGRQEGRVEEEGRKKERRICGWMDLEGRKFQHFKV